MGNNFIFQMTGTPVSAHKRMQFSLPIQTLPKVSFMSNLPTVLFPIMWVEEVSYKNHFFVTQCVHTNLSHLKNWPCHFQICQHVYFGAKRISQNSWGRIRCIPIFENRKVFLKQISSNSNLKCRFSVLIQVSGCNSTFGNRNGVFGTIWVQSNSWA